MVMLMTLSPSTKAQRNKVMGSLAERIDPPFYAAILNDNTNQRLKSSDHLAPTDEMVSLAPGQPGFLGLETSKDQTGKWVAVSYWRDMDALNAWEKRGDFEIRKHFDGASLTDTCALRVTKVSKKIRPSSQLRAKEPAISTRSAALVGLGLFGLFTALAGLLGYEQHIG
jgi:heme-degrading monooxygenase HmoA